MAVRIGSVSRMPQRGCVGVVRWALVAAFLAACMEAQGQMAPVLADDRREDPGGVEERDLGDMISRLERSALISEREGKHEIVVRNMQTVCGSNKDVLAFIFYSLGTACMAERFFVSAEDYLRRSLAEADESKHRDLVLNISHALSLACHMQGNFKEAETQVRRSLSILEEAGQTNTAQYVDVLDDAAGLCKLQGRFREALSLCDRALGIATNLPDRSNRQIANLLIAKGVSCQYLENNLAALDCYYAALGMLDEKVPEDRRSMCSALRNMSDLCMAIGQNAEAERLALRARELEAGDGDFGRPETDLRLARLKERSGDKAGAESLFRSAMESTREDSSDPLAQAESMNNTAAFYMREGKIADAEKLITRAVELAMAKPDDRRSGDILNTGGVLYMEVGRYKDAERLFRRVVAILLAQDEKDMKGVGTTLGNLAATLINQNKVAEAEQVLTRAIAMMEIEGKTDIHVVGQLLNSLALIHVNNLDDAKAESCYLRAIRALKQRTPAVDQMGLASALQSLGFLYDKQGKTSEALPLYLQAIEAIEQAAGKHHPNLVQVLENLGIATFKMNATQESVAYLTRALDIQSELVRQMFSFSSEKERLACLRSANVTRAVIVNLVEQQDATGLAELALETILSRKGIVQDSLIEDMDRVRMARDPVLSDAMERLRETRGKIAQLAIAGIGEDGREAHIKRIRDLEIEAESLEKSLARGSAKLGGGFKALQVKVAQVAAALPPGSALVEFAKYQSCDFRFKGPKAWGGERYLALVLLQGGKAPIRVKLGEAEEVDRLIHAYQQALGNVARWLNQQLLEPDWNSAEGQAMIAGVRTAVQKLERALWAPIKEALGPVRHVYLSPDGELNFVSFASLLQPGGRYVLEDYDLAYVSSGRDLVRGTLQEDKTRTSAVLFGAPDYGGMAMEEEQPMITREGRIRSDPDSVRGAFEGFRFKPLPGTQAEVIGIEALLAGKGLTPKTRLGIESSEARVKDTEQPRILHLATHGFFLPDSGWAKPARGSDTMPQRPRDPNTGEPAVEFGKWNLENPMHRSGLALAGANVALEGMTKAGDEDGILTAEEVAGLNLAGTELVVLSACETGLGEAKGGEGVLGLRRAFVRAGTENLVMALWSVSDKATQNLMTAMYGKYLGGLPVWKALLDAQREALDADRKTGHEPNVFLWGAFVASGIGAKTGDVR